MNLHKPKSFIVTLILLAYIGIGVFGLFQLGHTTEMPMANCPYSVNSFSVCDGSINHIDHWRQFSNTTITSILIFSVLMLGIVLYFLNKHKLLNQKQYFYRWKYYIDNQKSSNYLYRIIKWLSLFENSPPVHRASIIISNLKKLCKQKISKKVKTINSSIQKWPSILSAEWNLMQTALKQAQTTKVRPTTFALSTAKITLQPIL